MQAVSGSREVVQPVQRRQPAGGAEVVEQVAHPALPVQPREVGVAEHLDAAPDVVGFRRPRGVVEAVGVVVAVQPPGVPASRVGPVGSDLRRDERDQLHVRQAHGAAHHAPRHAAGGDPPVLLADHQILTAHVGDLPEQLPDPVPPRAVGHRAGDDGGARIPAQAGQHHHVLRGLRHQPQRHRVVPGGTQRVGEVGSVRLLVGPHHRAGQPLERVRQQPPVASARARVQRGRRPACVQVGAVDRRLREPAVANQISARSSHASIVEAWASGRTPPARATTLSLCRLPGASARDRRCASYSHETRPISQTTGGSDPPGCNRAHPNKLPGCAVRTVSPAMLSRKFSAKRSAYTAP